MLESVKIDPKKKPLNIPINPKWTSLRYPLTFIAISQIEKIRTYWLVGGERVGGVALCYFLFCWQNPGLVVSLGCGREQMYKWWMVTYTIGYKFEECLNYKEIVGGTEY